MENQNGYFNPQYYYQPDNNYGYAVNNSYVPNNGYMPNNGYAVNKEYNTIQKDPFINSEAKHIKRLGILAGAAILAFLGLQSVIAYIIRIAGLYEAYTNSYDFQFIVGAIISIICIFIPFFIVYMFYPKGDREICFDFGAPISSKAFCLAVPAGLMVCFLSDYISSGFNCFISSIGVSFIDIESENPSTMSEFLLMVVAYAVVPALVEEFAVRGVIMQPLRRYGDKFAIVMSSVIFGIMHGNMVQIPFAMIAGIALGYFAIATKSIWTSVTIHFLNNFISVLFVSLNSIFSIKENTALVNLIIIATMLGVIIAGIFCLRFFIKTNHKGLGLTFAPKKYKTLFWISAAIFIALSFIISLFNIVITNFYTGSVAFLLSSFFIYLSQNRKMLNAAPLTGLSEKMMTSLYVGSPTLILATYSLLISTLMTISNKSIGNIVFCLALFAVFYLIFIPAVVIVNESKEIENKGAYKLSIIILSLLMAFTLIFMLLLLLR